MNPELIENVQKLWDADRKIQKFGSRFNVYPVREAGMVYEEMGLLVDEIPYYQNPQTTDELYESELKRSLIARVRTLEHFLKGNPYTLEDVIALYGLENEDLAYLRPWLLSNRDKTIETIERLFKESDVQDFELDLSTDIPKVRREADKVASRKVAQYHQVLGRLFGSKSTVGNSMAQVSAYASRTDRSYYNSHTKRLAISISGVCYELPNGTIRVRDRELLRVFGHEATHAIQDIISSQSELPFFLRQSSDATIATEESLTEHYEQVIFDDVQNSPEAQHELGISTTFGDIYQEQRDAQLIVDYNSRLFHYTVLVLADKSLGDPRDPEATQKRVDLLSEVALVPGQARGPVEHNRFNYDSQGNLQLKMMKELRYASRAVDRAMREFSSKGFDYDNQGHRDHIDMTFLTGYFTPQGFVQKAQLATP